MRAAPRGTRVVVVDAATNNNTETDTDRQRVLRQSEKRSRVRRVEKMRSMQAQVEILSQIQCVLPLVDDADAMWDGFLDDDQKRMRDRVRRLLPAAKEIQRLHHEKTLLTRLIEEHTLMVRAVVVAIAQAPPVDDWKSTVQRWRALARIHFRPWTLKQCEQEMETALHVMDQFNLSNDKQSTGFSFLGWQDSRRLDGNRSRLQFQFHKIFRGYDVTDYMDVAWQAYKDAKTYCEVIIGPRAPGAHDVLQQLGPDIMIVRGAMRYESLGVDAHIVYLVFRVKTERGFTQCVRSISCPEVVKQINTPNDVWPSNFIWLQWEPLEGEEKNKSGYKLRIGGSMGEIDIHYANMWMVDAFGCVLRSEYVATRRPLLTVS